MIEIEVGPIRPHFYFLDRRAILSMLEIRPVFGPTQILGVDELTAGKVCHLMRGDAHFEKATIVDGIPFTRDNCTWIRVIYTESQKMQIISLADKGVLPYRCSDGVDRWNPTNWLADPSKELEE